MRWVSPSSSLNIPTRHANNYIKPAPLFTLLPKTAFFNVITTFLKIYHSSLGNFLQGLLWLEWGCDEVDNTTVAWCISIKWHCSFLTDFHNRLAGQRGLGTYMLPVGGRIISVSSLGKTAPGSAVWRISFIGRNFSQPTRFTLKLANSKAKCDAAAFSN